jgi:HEAT repeat protein
MDLIARMTVKETYNNSDHSIGWHAHREAENLADAWMVDELAEYLSKERDKKRRSAAYFILGKLGKKIRNSDCASILLSRVDKEQDKYVLSSLLDLLSELHKPGNLDLGPVFRLLRDESWQVRYSAIQALSHADSPEAEDKLIEILTTTSNLDDILYCQVALHETVPSSGSRTLKRISTQRRPG